MSEQKSHVFVEAGSERSFGFLFSVFFLGIGLYPLLHDGEVRVWSGIISVVFFIISIVAPKLLHAPNKIWFKFGMLLGAIIAPIVMSLIYFFAITPIGLVLKLLRIDVLRQRLDKKAKSYWIRREEPVGSMKNQF